MKFLLFLLLGLFAGAFGQGYDRSGDICNMKEDEGPCKALLKRWRWDFEEGNCVEFNYGGCEERIILDQILRHREETTRDDKAGFRPGRSTIDQAFIVRRVIEVWQQYSEPLHLAFLDFEAAFDLPLLTESVLSMSFAPMEFH
ncbi:hypothetical protein RB195_020259 [Necator americanus]|uniref:BPTI/Kunitz inhibitor domain-containing protein n=1 Tax=Necator americanus TaxID=51031 RepID=A0ABR1CKB7_NECAM